MDHDSNQTITVRAAKDGLVLAGSSNTQTDGQAAQGFDTWPGTPPPYARSPSPD